MGSCCQINWEQKFSQSKSLKKTKKSLQFQILVSDLLWVLTVICICQ